jgi:hypothetical protein
MLTLARRAVAMLAVFLGLSTPLAMYQTPPLGSDLRIGQRGFLMPERIGCRLAAILAFTAATWFLDMAESIAAPHQLDCSLTIRHDSHEQRTETRSIKFIYEDRESTLFYVDDGGGMKKCINSAVGTLKIVGSCGSESVWIDRSTYQVELNTFDYRWNALRHVNEETWAYEEKGWCKEIDAQPQ